MTRELPWSHGNPMGIRSIGMGTEMGLVDKKWMGNWSSSLEEIPVSRVNHILALLANVNSRSCSLYVVVLRLSVVCNVRAPYSGD